MAFFSSYVPGLSHAHDTLAALTEQAGQGSHLVESVDAVSLVFLAHHYRDPKLSRLASGKYLKAIQQINQVLQNPQLAIEDSTLQSVLLLDLYEKLANREHLDAQSWIAHVNGAVALVKVRGQGNISNDNARQLSKRLLTTSIISCAVASMRVPEALVDLHNRLDPYFLRSNVKWRMSELAINLISFQADMYEGILATDTDILDAAWILEARFIAMQNELLPFWQPKRVTIAPGNPLVYAQHYDLYQDQYITQGSMVFRTWRLLLHNTIQTYSSRNAPADDGAVETSQKITDLTSQEICAAVPQFILKEAKPTNALPLTSQQILQCYALLPPLYIAGRMSKDPGVRPWVIGILKYMARVGGMESANRIADVLQTSNELPYWSVYAMLGSYAFAA
ncbi:hypothetical protein MMC10_007281 [Thelotrema lepadinum]|nr:hypothetical protein [Thelotrema lepadinum]